MQLVFMIYNNYLNRQFKIEQTVSDYYDNAANYFIVDDYDFNPNDGVDTNAIVGGEDYDYFESDYMIAVEDNKIVSRWFILDATRTRYGQYQVKLHRDVLADSKDVWTDAPAYIEKGYIDNINNPVIFMQEGLGVNQIKKEEVPLYDKTGSPWICAFFKEGVAKSVYATVEVPVGFSNYEESNIEDFWLQPGTFSSFVTLNSHIFDVRTAMTGYRYKVTKQGDASREVTDNKPDVVALNYDGPAPAQIKNAYSSVYGNFSTLNTVMETYGSNYVLSNPTSQTDFVNIKQQDGIIVKDATTEKYWKYRAVLKNKQALVILDNTESKFNIFRFGFNSFFENSIDVVDVKADDIDTFKVLYNYLDLVVTRTEVTDTLLNISTIDYAAGDDPEGNKYPILNDAPYGMIFMPIKNVVVTDGAQTYIATEDTQMALYSLLSRHLSTAYGIDSMILPYCPIPELTGNGTFNGTDVSKILLKDAESVVRGGLYFARLSSFKGIINHEITVPSNPIDFKTEYETKMYRLCSTGYATAFEFSPTKNYGVNYFNYQCTYKPFNPYIRISPNFKGMYGQEFEDNRGLVVSGDFSLPQVTDEWKNYQVNNKNYDVSFNRQLQSMDTQRKYQKKQEIVGIVSGGIGGGGTAAGMGAMAGGPVGAAIGLGIGGGLSVAGGLYDLYINNQLFEENKSFAQDQFNYSIDNIKALPIGLTKSSGWNADSDYVPFLEIYDCTEEEKEAYRSLIEYKGMTIMRIGKPKDYSGKFIKGSLIRLDDLNQDYHFADTVRKEFSIGVYM